MKSRSLFDEDDDEIVVHPDRTEPLIWLKEVRLLEALDASSELIREPISFRRGLNIIATEKNPGDSDRPVGHNLSLIHI